MVGPRNSAVRARSGDSSRARRIHVVCSSIPVLDERVRALGGPDVELVLAGQHWVDEVEPGDAVVADHWVDRAALEVAARRGATWLHILSTGIDSFDLSRLPYATLTCSRGISGGPIAEYVLAMMLARAKRLDALLVAGDVAGPLEELAGQTVGVVGHGAIGARIASLAVAFGMHVRVLRRRSSTKVDAAPVTQVHDITSLVQGAHHVVLAAPLTAATRRIIDAAVLDAMAPGSHLVNVARGGLVDHHALLAALERGRPAWCTLDVTDPEPLPADHPLLGHPRVIVTRHLAGRVEEAANRNWAVFADNVVRWRAGLELGGAIDRAQGY